MLPGGELDCPEPGWIRIVFTVSEEFKMIYNRMGYHKRRYLFVFLLGIIGKSLAVHCALKTRGGNLFK